MTEKANSDEIYTLIDDITNKLSAMTKEARLEWFKRTMYPEPLDFINEIDGTVYVIRSFFDSTAKESLDEKIQRIVLKKQ